MKYIFALISILSLPVCASDKQMVPGSYGTFTTTARQPLLSPTATDKNKTDAAPRALPSTRQSLNEKMTGFIVGKIMQSSRKR